jgi:hypothetical protein
MVQEECSICLENMVHSDRIGGHIHKTECNHSFHLKCLTMVVPHIIEYDGTYVNCPYCRHSVKLPILPPSPPKERMERIKSAKNDLRTYKVRFTTMTKRHKDMALDLKRRKIIESNKLKLKLEEELKKSRDSNAGIDIDTMSFADCIQNVNDLSFQQTVLEREQENELSMMNIEHARLHGVLATLV